MEHNKGLVFCSIYNATRMFSTYGNTPGFDPLDLNVFFNQTPNTINDGNIDLLLMTGFQVDQY